MQHNFKVGDKVKVKPYSEFDFTDELYDMCQEDIKRIAGKVFQIIETDQDGDIRLDTSFIGYQYYIHPEQCELVETSTKNPRKHAELIKQWADDDSLEIQVYCEVHKAWIDISNIIWSEHNEYRIKTKMVTKWQWAYRIRQDYPEISLISLTEEDVKSYPGVNPNTLTKLDWTAKEFEI